MFLVLRTAARAEGRGMWLDAERSGCRLESRLEQRNASFCTTILGLLVPDRCLHLSDVRFF